MEIVFQTPRPNPKKKKKQTNKKEYTAGVWKFHLLPASWNEKI